MALTIIQAPATYAFVGSPMWLMVSGSLSAVANFKYGYYVDVDPTNSGTFTNKSLVKQSQRPSDGFGVYDPRLVLRDFIPYASGNISLTETSFNRDPAFMKFRVRAGEMTGSINISTIQTVVSGFCFLGAIKTQDFPAFSISNYFLADSSKKFLTNSPRTRSIYTSEHAWLYLIQGSNAAYRLEVCTYTADGSLYNKIRIDNSYTNVISDVRDQFQRIAVGTYQLNQIPISGVTVVTGPTPTNIILPQITKYTLQTVSSGNTATSELFTFNVVDANCKYDTLRLHFMNRFGKFDSFTFPLVSRKFADTERRTYQQPLGTRSGATYGYSALDRGTTQFYARTQERLKVTSDWVTTDEASWLEELFESPCIYLQTDSSTLVPMVMNGNSIEMKKNVNDGVVNYEFELSYANANEW